MLSQIFLDALTDTAKMVPLLLLIYVGIELIEYKWGDKIRKSVEKAGSSGPAIGAIAGSFPQCGFSVVTTALYTERLVTIGTLLAVYLSTSDEAIPVILSQPNKINVIVPLILTKVLLAIIAGYLIDFVFRKTNKKTLAHIEAYETGHDEIGHHHENALSGEAACCGHCLGNQCNDFEPKEIFLHPAIHTAKIFLFIFITTLLINIGFAEMGPGQLSALLLSHSFLQPFLAALVGLIPNCAASVALTQLYLKGGLSFGSVIAGLSASGGLGLLVLLREEKESYNVFRIITLLYLISVICGLVIQYLPVQIF